MKNVLIYNQSETNMEVFRVRRFRRVPGRRAALRFAAAYRIPCSAAFKAVKWVNSLKTVYMGSNPYCLKSRLWFLE